MVQSPAPIRLFEDEHVELLFRPGSTSYTLATFSNFGFRHDGASFWGRPLCDALDIECLGFVAKQSNWFPKQSTLAAVQAATGLTTKPIVTYGHSQGGYAALKYAAALRAAGAIAGSPQFSIDPDVVKDRRFASYFNNTLNQDMELRATDFLGQALLIYDPLDLGDQEHVSKIVDNGYDKLTLLPVYHVGHEIMEVLQRRELILSVIRFCLGQTTKEDIFNQARQQKKLSIRFSIKLAERLLLHNKPNMALNALSSVLKNAQFKIPARDQSARDALYDRAMLKANRSASADLETATS